MWVWAPALCGTSEPPRRRSTALLASRPRMNFIFLSAALHGPCWVLGFPLCHNDLPWDSAGARSCPSPPCVPRTIRCCDPEACLSPPWLKTSFWGGTRCGTEPFGEDSPLGRAPPSFLGALCGFHPPPAFGLQARPGPVPSRLLVYLRGLRHQRPLSPHRVRPTNRARGVGLPWPPAAEGTEEAGIQGVDTPLGSLPTSTHPGVSQQTH